MRSKGCSERELFAFLAAKRDEDRDHSRILSSMCTVPHEVAIRAHTMFMETNLGDPGLFPGTSALETLLVRRLGDLFHHPEAGGYATTGGTESNIQALRIAKVLKHVDHPNVVVPASAHFSFRKACDMLGLEMRSIPLDENYRMKVLAASESVDKNTVCLVGIAGTTEYGMIDPIADLAKLAAEQEIFFHVDAAFGGMVIPFLDSPVPFDFSLPGVSSIAVDPHKMGMGTIPAGCLLVRNPRDLEQLNIETPYLSVKKEFTLTGTRSGGSVAAAFAVLEYLGRDGMKAIVDGCMKNTRRLITGMETYGFSRAVTPDVNVATFVAERDDIPGGWCVSWTRQGNLRIVCMPHVSAENIEAFIRETGERNAGKAC
ncbi:MAG: tyrosine decarboxylase MfnA [Methanoregulaceae archaeon]